MHSAPADPEVDAADGAPGERSHAGGDGGALAVQAVEEALPGRAGAVRHHGGGDGEREAAAVVRQPDADR